MSLPESVKLHKQTLYLVFSPLCKPYAELAAWHHCKSTTATLKVGVDHNLLATQSRLIIPKGPLSAAKTVLVGKASIARFFARYNPAYYNEQDPASRYATDQLIDHVRAATTKSNKDAVEAVKAWSKIRAGELTLADFYAWDFALQNQEALRDVLAQFSDKAIFTKVQQEISDLIGAIPSFELHKYAIIEQVHKITGAENDIIYSALTDPRDKTHGDVLLPVPALKLAGNVIENGKKIAEMFEANLYLQSCTATGVFVNFKFNSVLLRNTTLRQVIKAEQEYGHSALGFGNLAIVEFSSPNIAKPFHAGHLRSTIIGNFINNVLVANGYVTLKINYLGDWGKQYGLLAVGYEKHGSSEQLEADPIKHLYEVYVKINADAKEDETIHDTAREYFKRMEDGNAEALSLWQKFRSLSIVKYKEMYGRLGISFDIFSGESQYSMLQMRSVLDELKAKSLLTLKDGALVVDLEPLNLGTAVIGKSDGSMLYLSRDIAAAQDRQTMYDFDDMFYIVAIQQDHHFKQLFKILELCGKTWSPKCHHISFGMIEGMSTRKGTVVFLQEILDQTRDEMHNVMRKNEHKYAQIVDPDYISDVVGMSSIMIQDMAARRIKDYTFDWSRMLSFEGDTGPYLQYAHARLCSIERGSKLTVGIANFDSIDLALLTEPKALALIDFVSLYPATVRETGANKEPVTLVKYCLRLSHCVSSAVTDLYVQNQPENIALARLAMYKAARIVLGNGLSMLGLKPVERM